MGIRRYEVTQPPTSGEVREHILHALGAGTNAFVHIRATGDGMSHLPRQDDERDLEFHIANVGFPEKGGMRAIGHTSEGATVTMSVADVPEVPATLSLVIPN